MSAFSSQCDILGSLSKYFCTYCQDEISPVSCRSHTGYTSKIIFIQCEICEEFYLCLMCFSCGVEIGSHKNYHNYKLVSFSIANVFSLNLLNALEEWVSEDTEKYLGTKKLVLSWKDVAKVVGVQNPKEIEQEYFDTFIDGHLGQCVINLVNKYVGNSQVVTLDRANEMDCFKDCPLYLPSFKYLKVPKNPEKLEDYEVLEESIRSNQHYNKGMIFRNKNIFDTYKLQLLLQCVGEFGYGNWKNISQLYNKTIQMEYPLSKCTYLTAIQIKEEYLQHFIMSPILRRTWSQLPNNRPLVPDRTKRIEGPQQLDYYHMLDRKLPIEDLDILFYPSKLVNYENSFMVAKVKPSGFKEECLVCTYCQEEFEVISYRSSNGALSYYELLSVYACCTNKHTCVNFYLCLTCLSSGAEIGKHKKNHSYKLISEVKRYSSEAFLPGSTWTALETLALLSASEEWLSDHTDKYINPLNSGNIITDWDSVAQHIRSKNAQEAKTQFEKLVLNQRIWKLFELHFPTDFLMTYEKANEMGCFDDDDIIIDDDDIITNIITIDLIENKDLKDEEIQVTKKKNWTKFQLELLLEYTAIYGYGNWIKISEELNTTIWLKKYKKKYESMMKTPKEVAEEYIFRFYELPMKRRSWNSIKHVEPIILDRTRFFKQPEDMKYPVVNSNLFSALGYNYATDDFEYPYMDIAESHFNTYCSEISMDNNYKNDINKLENSVSKQKEELYYIRKLININEEKALIALECYNNVLRDRRTAKEIVHNYELMELFEIHKDEPPKMKPWSEQTLEERLIKMARFMTADAQRALVIGIEYEKIFINMLTLLKFAYTSKISTKSTEIATDNIPLKRKVAKKQTLVDTIPECQTTTNNCFKYTHPKLSKLPYLKNMSRIPFLSNDTCDELLTKTEKMLCKKYNLNSNYFLTRKQDILINGLQENSSEADCIIYNYLMSFNKI